MSQKKTLTEKQQKFAEILVYNDGKLSPAEAAHQAGYTTRSRTVASEMRNPKYFPLVVKYIGELRAEVHEKYGVTLQKHITELAKLRDDAQKKGAWSAAINAEIARGKVGGLYVDQKMILTGSLDNMNEKELEDKMKQILSDYKDIINVTPSEQKSSSSPSEALIDPEDQDHEEEESPSTSH